MKPALTLLPLALLLVAIPAGASPVEPTGPETKTRASSCAAVYVPIPSIPPPIPPPLPAASVLGGDCVESLLHSAVVLVQFVEWVLCDTSGQTCL